MEREELIELLKKYKGILTTSMIDYLSSLIELEFSVIREYISDADRRALSELEVYKKIAIYNIYNRALNIFNQSELNFKIFDNKKELESLNIFLSLNNKNIKLFAFDYSEHLNWNDKIPNIYRTTRIGTISLYQILENKELREVELNSVTSKSKKLYNKHNPIEYERKFVELDSRKELNDEYKEEIETVNYFHDLLLEDYNLTNNSFEDEISFFNNFEMSSTSNLTKILVKEMPNLTITKNIKYV